MPIMEVEKVARFNFGKIKHFTKYSTVVKIKAITTWYKFRGDI